MCVLSVRAPAGPERGSKFRAQRVEIGFSPDTRCKNRHTTKPERERHLFTISHGSPNVTPTNRSAVTGRFCLTLPTENANSVKSIRPRRRRRAAGGDFHRKYMCYFDSWPGPGGNVTSSRSRTVRQTLRPSKNQWCRAGPALRSQAKTQVL